MSDQQAALDFEFVAIGRLTVLAKQIIATYYGKPVRAFLLRRLLHRGPRGDADVAALSDVL